MKLNFSIDSDRGGIPLNLYPVKDGEAGVFFRSTPGLVQWADTASAGPVRGMFAKNDKLYAASGQQLVSIDTGGTVASIGTLGKTDGGVWMTDNGIHLVVIDPPGMYLHNYATGTTSAISDTDFPGASCGSFLDGYIVFAKPDSQQFYITAGYDAESVDALDFASAEANPDEIVTLVVDHRELILFGNRTTEFWYNSGDVTFPLTRVQGSVMEVGCGAARTPASCDNSVMWFDNRGLICRADGYKPTIVSTRKIEREIASFSSTSDAYAYSYTHQGHTFYVITFPAGDVTYAYDLATQTWHRRAYTEAEHSHLGSCYAYFDGKHLVGSRENGIIYELNPSTYTDNGQSIARQWECELINGSGKHLSIANLYVDMEVGVGLDGGVEPGTDPQIMMQYSNDDGKTWSSEMWASFGAIGEYEMRAIFHRLGAARKRRFRFRVTDPNPVTIWGVHAQIRGAQA